MANAESALDEVGDEQHSDGYPAPLPLRHERKPGPGIRCRPVQPLNSGRGGESARQRLDTQMLVAPNTTATSSPAAEANATATRVRWRRDALPTNMHLTAARWRA